jgi:hypothetical protein
MEKSGFAQHTVTASNLFPRISIKIAWVTMFVDENNETPDWQRKHAQCLHKLREKTKKSW